MPVLQMLTRAFPDGWNNPSMALDSLEVLVSAFLEERRLNTWGTMKGIGTGVMLAFGALALLLVASLPGD